MRQQKVLHEGSGQGATAQFVSSCAVALRWAAWMCLARLAPFPQALPHKWQSKRLFSTIAEARAAALLALSAG